jgi:Raf kinase inhibitor-like YbhB/YbcL family protein
MRVITLVTAALLGWSVSARAEGAMSLTSPDIKPGATIAGEQVFNSFGCTGANLSPALNWTGAPAGTKSFAVTIYDPDAPTGSGFWHWIVYNIPADATLLAKGAGTAHSVAMPAGSVQNRNDYGQASYGGPCPPHGDPHHYNITVFAVDIPKLDGDENTSPAVIGFQLHFHTLAKATLTGLYGQ